MPEIDDRRIRKTLNGDFPPNPRAPYVELAVTTPYSFLRGASEASELAAAAHALGYDALGVADLNTMAGVVRIHAEARKAGLRPVIGCRLKLVTGEEFLAYPRDRAAWGRLCTLLTGGKRHDPAGEWQAKGACDIALSDLEAHAEGVQLIVIPDDGLPQRLAGLLRRLPGLRHIAASCLYRGDDRARVNRLDRLARAHGIGILATNDVHYHAPDRRPLHDVMTCIREKAVIHRAGFLLEANAERHLKPPAEMCRLFADWPHAIAATREVADACGFSLADLSYHYPRLHLPEGRTPQQELERLTWQGAAERYPGGLSDKVRRTLVKELDIIGRKDIAPYFLTIRQIVDHARAEGILCQGRGSAANSAVCYVLGITGVDPDKHELLFERFISETRDEPPDIDVDFEHERREEIMQWIYATYGRHRAGLCATVIHYRPRSAIREVGKAMGLSGDVTAALARTVWGSWGTSMDKANTNEAGLDLTDPLLSRTVRLAEQLIGMPRHLSQHVGGFILTEGPLHETVPIGNAAMPDRSFIEWDKDDIDELGIMKVDVLALGMLTCIRKCFGLLKGHYGVEKDLGSIPQRRRVYEMLQRGDAVGVFQVESRAQMNMLPRLKPKEFYDLVIEVAIVRPGPIQGDMVHPYLRRRNGEEDEHYPSPAAPHDPDELRHILSRTRGVPIFQEQAMKIAMVAAEFTDGEANELRKAMATFRARGTIGRLEELMVGRMIARGYDPDFARRCFDQIKGFGEYGFPESHAVSFAHLAYVSAWLKCLYPAAFACALLNSQPMGFYAPAQIVRDAQAHGVEVREVDVNFSDWDNMLEPAAPGEFALRLGLRQVEGLGQEAAGRLVAARDAPFAGPSDLAARSRLPARAIRALAAADAFRSAGQDRRAALWEAKALKEAPDLPLFRRGEDEGDESPAPLPAMPRCEQVVADYQTLRLSLKAHPMAFLRASMARQRFVRAGDLADLPNGRRLRLAGLVLIRQRPGSAKGVCFITLEDETGAANLVIWPKVMAAFRKVVMTARLMQVTGRLQRDPGSGVIHVVAETLLDRSDALLRLADRSLPPSSPAHSLPAPIPGHPRNARIIPNSRDFH